MKLALKCCMVSEIRWKRKRLTRYSPLDEVMRRPRALRKSNYTKVIIIIIIIIVVVIIWQNFHGHIYLNSFSLTECETFDFLSMINNVMPCVVTFVRTKWSGWWCERHETKRWRFDQLGVLCRRARGSHGFAKKCRWCLLHRRFTGVATQSQQRWHRWICIRE